MTDQTTETLLEDRQRYAVTRRTTGWLKFRVTTKPPQAENTSTDYGE